MTAGPQYGVVIFRGASGQTYDKGIYMSDVNGTQVRWDGGAGASATSPEDWYAPEPVVIRDVALGADLTDCKQLQICKNGIPTGDILRTALQLISITYRPVKNIPFFPGTKITFIQKT